MKYSIDPLPCSPFLQKYVDGGAKRQFSFALTSQEAYGQDTRINIESSGFFQSLGNWFEEQNLAGIFPELGNDKSPVWAEAVNSGCLYDASGENARYRIECRLIFIQEV